MIQHLLHISHVSKHFGGNVAVSDVSFSVDEKQIFGLIGHEHLEFLLDLDGVAAAETQLFDYLRRSRRRKR